MSRTRSRSSPRNQSPTGTAKPCLGRSRMSSGSQPRSASRRIHFFSRPADLQLGRDRGGELHQLVVEQRRARLERVGHRRDVDLRDAGRRAGRSRCRPRASGRATSVPRGRAPGPRDRRRAAGDAGGGPRTRRCRAGARWRVEPGHVARVALGRVERQRARSAAGPFATLGAARRRAAVRGRAPPARRSGSGHAVEPLGERGWRRSACSRRRTRRRRRR